MEEKKNYKYTINISILFILGVIMFIWGINLVWKSCESRWNLRHIYDEQFKYSSLKKGNYIKVTNPKLAGWLSKDGTSINVNVLGYIGKMFIEYDYYVMDFGDVFIPIRINYTEVRDSFYRKVDKKGIVNDTLWLKVCKSDSNARSVLIDAVNNGYRKNKYDGNEVIDSVTYSKKFLLVPINVNEEREMLFKGIWILLAGIIAIVASKPWKIIRKEYVIPEKEFNLVYDGKVDKNDMRILENTAYDLRLSIKKLESEYEDIRKNFIKSAIAFVISFVLCIWIKILMILAILSLVYFIKMIICAVKLFLNGKSEFAKKVEALFNKSPIQKRLQEENAKLEKCMRLIDVCIGVGGERREW